ncbi:YraN family protein [Moraxella sp. ZY200743]|uniref:YraN family protein n=1 Tax=Moraxella sp. ZY200743 TaxID=2911970 RepID=UPI003D7CA4B7
MNDLSQRQCTHKTTHHQADNKKSIGDFYEQRARAWAEHSGLELVACNFYAPRLGEIDIIAKQSNTDRFGRTIQTLIFIEVRSRKLGQFTNSIESITPAKQRKIIQTAQYFVAQNPQFEQYDCRFDVIAFDHQEGIENAQWVQAAFLTQW